MKDDMVKRLRDALAEALDRPVHAALEVSIQRTRAERAEAALAEALRKFANEQKESAEFARTANALDDELSAHRSLLRECEQAIALAPASHYIDVLRLKIRTVLEATR